MKIKIVLPIALMLSIVFTSMAFASESNYINAMRYQPAASSIYCGGNLADATTLSSKSRRSSMPIQYYKHNPNYPILYGGNTAGTVMDLSSAYVQEDNDEYIQVEALTPTVYMDGTMEVTDNTIQMRKYKKNGTLEFRMSPSEKFNPESRWYGFNTLADFYELVVTKLGI